MTLAMEARPAQRAKRKPALRSRKTTHRLWVASDRVDEHDSLVFALPHPHPMADMSICEDFEDARILAQRRADGEEKGGGDQ